MREFFVLSFRKNCAISLVLLPHFGVTPWISKEVTISLSLVERRAVDEEFAIEEPEDPSDMCVDCASDAYLVFPKYEKGSADG